jgi:hypothetical protein
MADQKPVLFLWSKAAVNAAGSELGALQIRLSEEVADIVSRARRWFVHSVPPDSEGVCYTCNGKELLDKWEARVQMGQFKPRAAATNNQTSARNEGASVRFPRADENPDNEIFAPYEEVEASLRQKGD